MKDKETIPMAPPTPEEEEAMAMYDRIDLYISGQMTPEEERAFLKECDTNKELKQRAAAMAYMIKAIRRMHS